MILTIRKRHESMEDQFDDPDDNMSIGDVDIVPTTAFTNDELDKYLKMSIEDIY